MAFYITGNYKGTVDIIGHFHRILSAYIVKYVLAKLRITPNFVTISRGLLAIPGLFFLAQGTYTGFLIGTIAIYINFIGDFIDGDLARFTNKSSYFGEFCELMTGNPLTNMSSLTGLAIAVGLYKMRGGDISVFFILFFILYGVIQANVFTNYLTIHKNERTLKVGERTQKICDNFKKKNRLHEFYMMLYVQYPFFFILCILFYGLFKKWFGIDLIYLGFLFNAILFNVNWLARVLILSRLSWRLDKELKIESVQKSN